MAIAAASGWMSATIVASKPHLAASPAERVAALRMRDKAEGIEKTGSQERQESRSRQKGRVWRKRHFKPTVALDPKAAQADNGEPAKDTGAHAHAEATTNSHRGVTADAANTAATNDGNAIATVSKHPISHRRRV